MSFSGLLTALTEYVGDVLVNDCGRPAPAKVTRYFGTQGLPQDCCDARGVLSTSWDEGWASEKFPQKTVLSGSGCTGMPVYTVAIRYDVCWTPPSKVGGGLYLPMDTWDTDAAMLADTADCVARALIRLACGGAEGAFADAVRAAARGNAVAYVNVVPNAHPGSCARLTWHLYCGPLEETPIS